MTLLSALLFKERLTGLKLLAVLLAFLGCALVSGLGAGDMALSTAGILYGLGAGFGYAMYSIFARYALERGYSSNTINFYSCLLAALGAALIWGVDGVFETAAASGGNLALAIGAASSPATCPICSIPTASRGMETGRRLHHGLRRACRGHHRRAQPCSTSVWAFCHTAASCSCSQP